MATAKSGKVIISCAITGSIHTPTMSDALPITPDEIAAKAIEAAEAGAAILHLHACDPKDGRPAPDPAVYMRFLPRIKQATDAVVNITTGGSVHMSLEERLAAPLLAKPEMCSLYMEEAPRFSGQIAYRGLAAAERSRISTSRLMSQTGWDRAGALSITTFPPANF
jgi:uncharacterized protein (DUF849 family)